MGQQDTLIEYFCPADNYGKGLLYRKRLSKYIFYSSFSLLTFATKK